MTNVTADWVEELKQSRDELRLKMHLGSMEAKQEWAELEQKWSRFAEEARLCETGEQLEHSLRQLGRELKAGYERVRAAIAK